MNWKIFFMTFGSIFLAELGDKTQLATIAFTADNIKYKWIVFFAAASALVLTSFLGVFFGHLLTSFLHPKYIKLSAGVLFILIGIFMIVGFIREAPAKHVKLIEQIEKVYTIQKCRYCTKFNEFAEKYVVSNQTIKLELTDHHHEPYNCEECNTDKLRQFEEKISKT